MSPSAASPPATDSTRARALRVLHVGKYFAPFAGGIENFMHDLMLAQQRAGLAITAVVHDHERNRAGAHLTVDGCDVWRCRTLGRLLYTPLSPGFRGAVRQAIRQFQLDVLHVHVPNVSAFTLLTLAEARAVPWVLHWHSDVLTPSSTAAMKAAYQVYGPLERRLLRQSAAVICTSPPYAQASLSLAAFRDKIAVVPLAVSPDRLSAPSDDDAAWAASQWPAGAFRLLCVGRLTPYKGHAVLLKAMADDAVGRAHAALVGDGPLAESVRRQLGSRVSMLGKASLPRLRALLASCDALVLPSLDRNEAFGLVLLEAMWYGKPLIASDIPGAGSGWIVSSSGAGLTVPPGDSAALAQAIARLAGDAALRSELSRRATAAIAGYRIDAIEQQVRAVYDSCLRRPRTAARG